MIKSLCAVRLSALGDVLMMVPLIRRIQDQLPETAISWVISKPAYDLVASMEKVEFLVIDKPNSPADYWRFKKQLGGRQFDALLATQSSFRANLLYPLIRAKRKIGYDSVRAKDGHHWFINETITPGKDHTLEAFLKFADAMGLDKTPLRWDLPIAEEDYAWAAKQIPEKKPLILINPAASKPERSWPTARYVEVIRHLQKRWQAQVMLIGGPGVFDRTLANAILQDLSCIDMVGKTKPKQLLALISQADLLICPDTGPSHMAAAVGTPVIALHAVTSADVSGPYTFKHLAVDYYPQAVEKVLHQTMETVIWGTHAHGASTMELVPVPEVLQQIDKVILEITARAC